MAGMVQSDGLLKGVPILVVEDDPGNARLLAVMFAKRGADVRTAPDAEAAVAILKTFRPAIIALDLVLPRMSGLLLVRQLKAAPATRDIPVIAMSIMDGSTAERLALEGGCAAFVSKPIDSEAYMAVVMDHVKGQAGGAPPLDHP